MADDERARRPSSVLRAGTAHHPNRSGGGAEAGLKSAPVSAFEYGGAQYVVVYAEGNLLAGPARGDRVWLFPLYGELMNKRPKRQAKEATNAPPKLTGVARLLSQTPDATLDLHGYTADQVQLNVRDFLATHSRISAGSVVHVITGKGTSVLLELVRDMLAHEAAEYVDEYAGMVGGGGWVVRVK